MKKGLLYHCLVLSVIFHLALVWFIRLDQSGKKKEKEPIAIDLVEPPNLGPKTVLPPGRGKEPPFAKKEEKAPTRMARIMPYVRPAFPSLPSPAPSAPSLPSAPPKQPQAPGEVKAPATPQAKAPSAPSTAQGGNPSAPSAASQGSPGGTEGPRKLVRPTEEDLERYARLDRDTEKTKDNETITLDTDDLMYTAYLDGLKRRIELIWKYPETARRDGLQGSLVMKFTIEKSGKVEGENIQIIKSSGYPMLDDAARQALVDASPFNPLPDNWKKDSFTITGTFIYRLYGLYLR